MGQWVNEESKGKSKDILKQVKMETKTYKMQQNILRGKFIVINIFTKKKKSQINNLTVHFKKLEKTGTNSAQN